MTDLHSNLKSTPLKPTVLFDGGCPLCRKEIDHYRRLADAENLEWVDVTQTPDLLSSHGVSVDEAMRRMHVRNARGEWKTGGDAFVVLWLSLKRYRWLGHIVSWSPATWIANRVYDLFSERRYRARCKDGYCAMPAERDH